MKKQLYDIFNKYTTRFRLTEGEQTEGVDCDEYDSIINEIIKLLNENKKINAKEISNHWYNKLHGKFNPITQKQKLAEFIKNMK